MEEQDIIHVAENSRYPLEAFIFIQRGLDFTVRRIHCEPLDDFAPVTLHKRHVTGEQLCEGLKGFAQDQYGRMARTVLARWRIHSCEDFGRIVFAMVQGGLMHKNEEDTIDDFTGRFDFEETFDRELSIAREG